MRITRIETEMVDRYMEFMVKTVRKLEKSTGRKINMATDVALCYFLLKNEPYVKKIKDKYLRVLNRGDELLDGAERRGGVRLLAADLQIAA